jgi:hypothetical protein
MQSAGARAYRLFALAFLAPFFLATLLLPVLRAALLAGFLLVLFFFAFVVAMVSFTPFGNERTFQNFCLS